ncbi:MAG TPA: hypothetical protein PLI05_08625 [Methanotrichaceae archaeon]|nr:hypothetical protein [Methanotrichaceae archaeon]HQI91736.1 hypothetical protein [Methanotrichaceae archaeon]
MAAIIVVAVFSLSCCGLAYIGPWDPTTIPVCPNNEEPWTVDPGEEITVDGESSPDFPDNTEVEYAWAFITDEGVPYPIYDGDTLIPMPDNRAGFTFNAPLDPGCYKMVLTVTYSREVEGSYEMLYEECISYTCMDICVNEYPCTLCDDTFCEDLLPENECPAVLCYDNVLSESFSVHWFIDGNDVGSVDGTSESHCITIDWSTYTNTIHYVEMKIFGPDDQDTGLPDPDCTGVVSKIDRPVAEIKVLS